VQLTVRDASRLLNTLEKTVYGWIKHGRLPAYRLQNQFRFNRAELLEWATARKLPVSPDIFEPQDDAAPVDPPSDALRAGGIFYGVEGTDKASVLRAVVATMRLPVGIGRDLVLDVLTAREAMGSTVIHDGIAIPHVRAPMVLDIERPLLSLCFLATPLPCGAPDGKPLFALFSVWSPTVRAHLRLLSQLSFALRDADVRAVVEQRASPEEIVGELRRIETRTWPF
jgi:nitrogen PTS system EIIA component